MPITDTFGGTDGDDIGDDSGWSKDFYGSGGNPGSIKHQSGGVIEYEQYAYNSGSHCAVGYTRTDGTFPDDQYAELQCVEATGGSDDGPAVRLSGSGVNGGDGYYCSASDSGGNFMGLYRLDSGEETELSTALPPGNLDSDYIRLTVSGTSLTVSQNGATRIGPYTDSTHASGTPGIAAHGNTSSGKTWDLFECSDTTGGAATVYPPFPRRQSTLIRM